MKKILFLILLLFIVSCTDNRVIFESDFAKMKGVKTMTVTEIEPVAKFNEIIPGDTLTVTICEYDEAGKPLSIEVYDEDGLSETAIYSWEGNKSKMVYKSFMYSFWHDELEVFDEGYIVRTYDSEGRETLSERFKEPEDTIDMRFETFYELNKSGRVEVMYRRMDTKTDTTYFIPEKSGGMTKITYNAEFGVDMDEMRMDEDYWLNFIAVFGIDKMRKESYDKYGNLLESISYKDRKSEQVSSVSLYDIEYNEIDRPAKVIEYRRDEPSFIYCYEYELY